MADEPSVQPAQPPVDMGRQPTVYDEDYQDYKALVRVLFEQGVTYEEVDALIQRHSPLETVQQLSDLVTDLWSLAVDQHGLPREWLTKQVSKFRRRGAKMDLPEGNMGWIRKADGPEIEVKLPTALEALPSPAAGGMPPAPKAGPEKAPAMPKSEPKPEVAKVHSLLDKGDLEGALSALKALIGKDKPGAEEKKDHHHHKAPDLGGDKSKAEDKDKAPAAPKSDDKAEKKPEPAPMKSAGSVIYHCGACGVQLEPPAESA